MAKGRHSLVSMMKDEGPRLLEWLAYHRLIGVDTVWIWTNDCRDGTDAMLDRLAAMGLCRHLPNDVPPGRKPQPHALGLADRTPGVADTGWMIVLDADEFLHVKAGDGTLPALLAACPDGTEGVAIPWRTMGSNGIADWSAAPLLDQFTRGAPEGFRRGWGVKTLFRPFPHQKLGIHRPTIKGAKRDEGRMAALMARRWVNGSGVPMPPSFLQDGWRCSAATAGYGLAEIAHFAVQSREAYLLRGDRGNVNLKPDKYDATYFAVFDRNEEALPQLSRWSPAVAALVDDWLQDAELKRLLRASIDWHRARLGALRDTPGFAARMAALERAAAVPYDALDGLLFVQPLTPAGKRRVAEMRAAGVPDAEIARHIARAVQALEAQRDAREAAELRAMGVVPAGGF
ncbi:glycosyltransferase family 2 protein [Roseicyclus persicicus]|uniref:Glycosyltransferase family 2 protein n=1 Tax=Roseicyclus persicicus TaxID=2650661 RepID=A0A7X6GXY2_9RHOB|nr:glycosyltransferase family 2 protein [Roseibacterium persicicum]NKX43553.1 glycosyltransferase family 2 protein [Roseibacterium persicicum]